MARDHVATIRSARQKLLEQRREIIELLNSTGHSDQLQEQIDRLEVIQRGLDLLDDALDEEKTLVSQAGDE